MPSVTKIEEITRNINRVYNLISLVKQLITPKPCPLRGKPFPLGGNDEWFIYPHGKSVYLYNLKDPMLNREYREHAYPVGVAKLSPDGALVASGDQNGNLRIFTLDSGLTTKLEVRGLGGRINDLCWSEDGKYIGMSGEGREQFANVVKVDGGASFGELIGPTKASSSLFLTSTHCYLASDDKSLTIYGASPTFKFVKSLKDHEGFVQVVKGSRDGRMVGTGGADGRVFIYSSDSYEVLMGGLKLHDAGILALEWCNNDENILTASADKTVKLWSLSGQLLCSSQVSPTWTFEKQICGLQVCSSGDRVIVMRLDGGIEIRRLDTLEIDQDSLSVFASIGHSKGIVDFFSKSANDDLISLSYDGVIKSWNPKQPMGFTKESTFGAPVQKLISSQIGVFEDKLKGLSGVELGAFGSYKIVGFQGESQIILSDGSIRSAADITTATTHHANPPNLATDNSCVNIAAWNEDSSLVAISTGTHLRILSGRSQEELYSEALSATKITAMAINGGSTLAIADDQRRVRVYTKEQKEEDPSSTSDCTGNITFMKQPTQWCNHSARIDALHWTRGGLLLSAGVDCCIMAWSLDYSRNGPMVVIRNAHAGPINCLTSVDDNLFMSGASDSCIKVWEMHPV